MKKSILYPLAAAAILFMFGFLAWAFSLHGTFGLFHVDILFRYVSISLGVLGAILLGLALLHLWLTRRHSSRAVRRLSAPLLILAAVAIVVPATGFVYLEGIPSSTIGDISPQLIVADVAGSHGIPNIAVVAYSERPTVDSLSWGKPGTESAYVISEERASRQHVFMLRDLEPGTQYWYRINGTETRSFTTPDISGQSLHFAVGSDAHFGASASRNDLTASMLEQIADPANGFSYLFSLGDLVQNGFRDSDWKAALKALSPTMSTIPTGLAAGNHDTMFTGASRYEKYCYPDGIDSESGPEFWHRIDVGRVHFLILDIEWSAESYTAQQALWLEEQLQTIPDDDWKIVMSHGFYYSSGSVVAGWRWYDNPETIQTLTPLFEKYGVDIVFSGHDHQLELLQKSDVTYVVCGGFGGVSDTLRTYTSPASLWYAGGEYGFADVTIGDTEAHISIRGPSNEVLQSLTLAKHK